MLTLVALAVGASDDARAAERPLRLQEAIALALAHNDGIVVERESVRAAEAAVGGAHGAYDPLLEVSGDWRRSTLPITSSFAGAPPGRLAPTSESSLATADLRQLLPTGGSVTLRSSAERRTTNGIFGLLSPSYATAVGVELRQPLLRDRAVDAARFAIRVAAADRSAPAACLQRQLSDTVADVETRLLDAGRRAPGGGSARGGGAAGRGATRRDRSASTAARRPRPRPPSRGPSSSGAAASCSPPTRRRRAPRTR